MKQTPVKTSSENRAHKIWAAVALVGLFGCGLVLGLVWHGDSAKNSQKQIEMSVSQCNEIARKITMENNSDRLRSLNEIFAAHCAGRVLVEEQPQIASVDDAKTVSTCEKIERLLLKNLNPADSQNAYDHNENASIYNRLVQHGCPENADSFKQLVAQEYAIANALGAQNVIASDSMRTCEEIENLLKQDLDQNPWDSSARLHNADVYSTLAEKGCPENTERFKQLALRQIEIATALARDQEMVEPKNAEIVIDTYKKLQMQQEAKAFLNKVQQLTDPAIEFILKMERVINE